MDLILCDYRCEFERLQYNSSSITVYDWLLYITGYCSGAAIGHLSRWKTVSMIISPWRVGKSQLWHVYPLFYDEKKSSKKKNLKNMLKKKSRFFKWKLQVKFFNQKFRQKNSLWKFTWSFHLKIFEQFSHINFHWKIFLWKKSLKKHRQKFSAKK